jgi:nickel/cobalt transporter (NicO) family protein
LELELAPLLALIVTGALAGALHALSPDHVIAVLPLSLDAGSQSWKVGLQWGGGHALGVLCVALGAYGAREWILPEAFEPIGELLLGLVLIGIGAWGLYHRDALQQSLTGEARLAHAHSHAHTVIAFGVGLLHAVVGSGAVLGAVPVLSLPSWGHAWAYAGGFGIGGIVAIGLAAVAVGAIARDRMGGREELYMRVFTATCWIAVACGAGFSIWHLVAHRLVAL